MVAASFKRRSTAAAVISSNANADWKRTLSF
jgi:hypothetical protein